MPIEETKRRSIAEILRERVKRGEFGSNGRLPSITQMSRDYETSRQTIYDVLSSLMTEGIITKKKNFYYAQNMLHVSANVVPPFEEVLAAQGMKAFVKNIIVPEVVEMPSDVASMFHQPAGLRVVHRFRVQGKDDQPYRLSEYWFSENLASRYLQDLIDDPGFDVIEFVKKDLGGITVQSVHDEVSSRLPTKEEAELLAITRTTPILDILRTNRTLDGIIVMHHRIRAVGIVMTYNYQIENRSA